ncbi:MAG: lipopolysaccharide biosynthesis protein [Pirellulales bacterium]|nr:lipopolysaccharide biosynthesis protein [Pirellulales bacterium]
MTAAAVEPCEVSLRADERAQPELGLRVDSLADSVALLLVLTVVQRMIGFARGMLFCRWLSEDQLGQWDVVLAFLDLAAPLVVLGLPGSFGRYVEYFRHRGQLRPFLARTSLTSLALLVVAVLTIVALPGGFSQLLFGTADRTGIVTLVGCCLATVIVHNFICELYAGLRMFRIVTLLQFGHGLIFASVSLSLIALWRDVAASVVLGYTAAGGCCAAIALLGLRKVWRSLPQPVELVPHASFWAKLVPYAAWIWVANWFTNLFVIADRYMLVHFSGLDAETSLQLVGQYHSSRILPLLLASIATMLATMILPHLSHDWEAGRREAVDARMRLVLKFSGLGMLLGGLVLQLTAPWFFTFFKGKFTGGLAVLDWTTIYCIWYGLLTIAQAYLWCAEKAWQGSIALALGLAANVMLNYALLPILGLQGVVYATAAGNAIALVLIYSFMGRLGLKFDLGVWLISAAPVALGFGPWVSLAAACILTGALAGTRWLLDPAEREVLSAVVHKYAARFRPAAV